MATYDFHDSKLKISPGMTHGLDREITGKLKGRFAGGVVGTHSGYCKAALAVCYGRETAKLVVLLY